MADQKSITCSLLILAALLTFSPAYAATLDTGGTVTIRANVVIHISTTSTMTTSESITTNRLRVDPGNGWAAFSASTAPAYILDWPYTYSSSLLNFTAPSPAQDATLTIVTSGWGTGVKIYEVLGSTAKITEAPAFDAANKKLTVKTSGTVTSLKVYAATEGKPINVAFDGQEKQEGSGWTWGAADSLVQIAQDATTYVVSWTSGGGGGGGGDGPVGGGPVELPPAAIPGMPQTPVSVAVDDSRLITAGSAAVIFIVTVTLVYRNFEKRLRPSVLFRKIKGWRKVKWMRKSIKW